QTPLKAIQGARDAYQRCGWADATDLFVRADAESELGVNDLEALVSAAGISAQDREMLGALERLYTHYVARHDHEHSARVAFWCGLRNMLIGEAVLGSAWLQRAARHAELTPTDCVQRDYLLLPQTIMLRRKGDDEKVVELAERAIEIGEDGSEPDLVALACSIKGGTLFRLGRISEGYVPIDEAMLLASSE